MSDSSRFRRGASRAHYLTATLAALLLLPAARLARAQEGTDKPAAGTSPEKVSDGAEIRAQIQNTFRGSRAWYLLSQTDTSGLLNGLPQRLLSAATEERRSGPTWRGIDDGARMKIRIETEGNVAGEILIGFFNTSKWEAAEPAQVRSFPGPGEYTVERLMPGRYWLGALAGTVEQFARSSGSLPEGTGLGVEKDWPRPIELRAGETAAADVRVSSKYQLEANHSGQFRGHFGFWGAVDPKQLVIVKTVDSDGNPLPYCSVTLSELVRGDDNKNHQFHGFGTDAEGQLQCDKFNGRFRVTAQKVDFIPELFAKRGFARQFPTVYQVVTPTIIRVPIDPMPSGTATLSGQVHDQHGKPLRGFYLTVTRDRKRAGFDWDHFWISMPFTSDDGSYSVPGLPPGDYQAYVRHFDYPAYDWNFGQFKVTIPDEPNANVKADFEVEAKDLFYGQAVFDNGKPVRKGGWIARIGAGDPNGGGNFSMNVEADGNFRVALSAVEKKKVDKYYRGTVEVYAYVGDQLSRVDVPIKDLSNDAIKPVKVVLPSKPVVDRPKADGQEGQGPGAEHMAWISDLDELGGEKRTLQLSDFKGKVLLLNLFGPWCPECIEKMPELVKLHEDYAKKGVVVLTICRGGDTRETQAYLKNHKLPFPVVSDADGFAVDFFRPGHAEPSYPTNVLLDTKGKRILRQVGFGGDNVNILRATIEHVLNENDGRQN